MVSYYGYTPSPGQAYDREIQKKVKLDPGFGMPVYTPGNAFEICPVCGCKSLRKNMSGKPYCGYCKKVVDFCWIPL